MQDLLGLYHRNARVVFHVETGESAYALFVQFDESQGCEEEYRPVSSGIIVSMRSSFDLWNLLTSISHNQLILPYRANLT